MRRQRERVGYVRRALAVVGALGLLAGVAGADVTTERGASILVFPKVLATGTHDTIIQITSMSNSPLQAHCFYVNGACTFGGRICSDLNPPLCTETDFDIVLSKQQPTMWVVSIGRDVNPYDFPCNPLSASCYGAGIDPGLVPARRVPPSPSDFRGELKCVEVFAQDGLPINGNHLKGEATIVDLRDGDIEKYNGLGIRSVRTPVQPDNILCLGGQDSDSCPGGAEYEACPAVWILNHHSDGSQDQVVAEAQGVTANSVFTDVTLVPCTENFDTQVPTKVTAQFAVTNEFEQTFSASTTIACWAELGLSEISAVFLRTSLNTDFVQTRVRSANGTASGFLMIGEEFHNATIGANDLSAAAAVNAHVEGSRSGGDTITIPDWQVHDQP